MFKVCVGMMIVTTLALVLSLYVPVGLVRTLSSWIILVPVGGIVGMSVMYILGFYIVPLRRIGG